MKRDTLQSLTIAAADRLMRVRLRRFLFNKCNVFEKNGSYDHLLRSETTLLGIAERGWRSTLKLWGARPPFDGDPLYDEIVACIHQGLFDAYENINELVIEYDQTYEHRDLQAMVDAYVKGFNPGGIIEEASCASAT